jgi:hypothetical protein
MLEYPRIVAQKLTSKQQWLAGVVFSLVPVGVAVLIYSALHRANVSNQPTRGGSLYIAISGIST